MKFTTGGHHSFKEEEIPIKVTVEIPVSENNILAIEKYKALVGQNYEQLVNIVDTKMQLLLFKVGVGRSRSS